MTGDLTLLSGAPVSRLGLAGNPDMAESRCVDVAFSAGVNAFFFYSLSFEALIAGLNRLAKAHRASAFVATGTEVRDAAQMQRYVDSVRRRLNVDVIDAFFAEYVSPEEDVEAVFGTVFDVLHRWKADGVVRYVGATAHSRDIALRLIDSGRVDVLMHRYNMAHRRSEDRVLPAALEKGVPVVSFTNTRWGSLLKGHRNWTGTAPTAADCYRFVLGHPAVRLALSAPGSIAALQENLAVLGDREPPSAETMAQWRAYGDLVYGDGSDAFETRWP